MIGVFDSGLGGLTVLRALVERFPNQSFAYFGDHANMPYGERPSHEVVALTLAGTDALFEQGCRLVIFGCNTATAVAARQLQQGWLIDSGWRDRGCNIVGIIAPTVEAATQTPWAVTSPQYPQKYNQDSIVVFGTSRTTESGVYREEIAKRCPRVTVIEQACPGLAAAIEARVSDAAIDALVGEFCRSAHDRLEGRMLDRAILGCTHYPLVEHIFRRHLSPTSRLLSQPSVVADSLEDYLARHPGYAGRTAEAATAADRAEVRLWTSGDPTAVDPGARLFWPAVPAFEVLADRRCG